MSVALYWVFGDDRMTSQYVCGSFVFILGALEFSGIPDLIEEVGFFYQFCCPLDKLLT